MPKEGTQRVKNAKHAQKDLKTQTIAYQNVLFCKKVHKTCLKMHKTHKKWLKTQIQLSKKKFCVGKRSSQNALKKQQNAQNVLKTNTIA